MTQTEVNGHFLELRGIPDEKLEWERIPEAIAGANYYNIQNIPGQLTVEPDSGKIPDFSIYDTADPFLHKIRKAGILRIVSGPSGRLKKFLFCLINLNTVFCQFQLYNILIPKKNIKFPFQYALKAVPYQGIIPYIKCRFFQPYLLLPAWKTNPPPL